MGRQFVPTVLAPRWLSRFVESQPVICIFCLPFALPFEIRNLMFLRLERAVDQSIPVVLEDSDVSGWQLLP